MPTTTTSAAADAHPGSRVTVDKSDHRVRRMFGQIAHRYDLLNHLLSLNIDRYWRWQTVRRVAPLDERPVLDVCTGTGDLALAYSRRAGGVLDVVASDFCQEMLTIATAKAARCQAERVRFLEADTQQLPFPDNLFQIVTVAFGLRNVEDTKRGLAEMTRVCGPRGRVAVLEFSTPSWQPLKSCYGWYFRHILPRIGQRLAGNAENAYNYLPESVGEFPQGQALADVMRTVGLEDVRYWNLTGGIAALYVGHKS